MTADRTIPLPKEFLARSNARALGGYLWAMLLFFGGWILVGAIWSGPWTETVKILSSAPLLIASGYGMLLLGFMGHDGTHFTLRDDKVVSCAIGIVATAPVFPYLVMGFSISHWNHHKFTNSDKDPDSLLFSKFRNLFSRALLARPYTFLEYGLNTFRLALGKPLPFAYQFPLSDEELRRLARFNIALSFCFGALYLTVALSSPVYFGALATAYLFGTVISGLSPYVEHTGTALGRGKDTRTAEGLWWDVFILGNNYHIEHHLYPTVPFYNLRRVHLYLKQQGYYSMERHVSVGVWDTYRYALSAYEYPNQHA